MKKAIFISLPDIKNTLESQSFIRDIHEFDPSGYAVSGDYVIILVDEETVPVFIEECRNTAREYNVGITIFDGIPDDVHYENVI